MSRELENKVDALAKELAEIKNMVMSIKSDSDYWIEKAAEQEKEDKRTGRPRAIGAVGFRSTGKSKIF